MNKAQELHNIAKEVKTIETIEDKENTQKAVNFFTKNLDEVARRGKFSKRTTCLVRTFKTDEYHCQTENDGSGFLVKNINYVIRDIEAMGFKVEFTSKKGYCPLTISW